MHCFLTAQQLKFLRKNKKRQKWISTWYLVKMQEFAIHNLQTSHTSTSDRSSYTCINMSRVAFVCVYNGLLTLGLHLSSPGVTQLCSVQTSVAHQPRTRPRQLNNSQWLNMIGWSTFRAVTSKLNASNLHIYNTIHSHFHHISNIVKMLF